MQLHLYTSDFDKWLHALGALHDRGGAWTACASVYSAAGHFNLMRLGCRAAAWLPLGREILIYEESNEVLSRTSEALAAQRDYEENTRRAEAACKKLGIRYLPLLLDYDPGLTRKAGDQ